MTNFVNETNGFEIDADNDEGIRVDVSEPFGMGWFLLRMSLHEPLLVLQVENDIKGYNKDVFTKLETFFKQYEHLNLEKLQAVL